VTRAPRWLDLAGADNARDLAGLPTGDGRSIQPHRLIRSDNLQMLTDADVRFLVDQVHVRAVADLRTGVEVDSEGPGPLTREPGIDVRHLSLFPEAGINTDAVAADDDPDAPVILPWQQRERSDSGERRKRAAATVYLGYLEDRPDSIVDALRLIADTDGATIVHCAAGKDRTGVVVALALAEVGVARDAIVADYVLTGERTERVLRRLATRRTYAADLQDPDDFTRHLPRASAMERFLDRVDERYGGVSAWLRAHGWTDDDAAALRKRLLD
jgi:protein tyrosine/serine phosphatase